NTSYTIKADGYYVQAGWFITGESHEYSASSATFGGVKPAGSGGAWVVFARFDALYVYTSAPIAVTGEKADSLTPVDNWYMNPLIRLSVNYVNVDTDTRIGGEDDGDAIVARLQVAF